MLHMKLISFLGLSCSRFLRRLWLNEDGATAIVTGIVMIVLMGFAGLAVEVGLWYGDRRSAQTVADAAALGAAYRIYEKGPEIDDIVEAGEADAARNGYVDGEGEISLTVSNRSTARATERRTCWTRSSASEWRTPRRRQRR